MRTTWTIENKEKTTKDEEYAEITFKDYRGEWTIKLDNSDARYFLEDLDRKVNYAEKI